jgi:subtilisin family serine protease
MDLASRRFRASLRAGSLALVLAILAVLSWPPATIAIGGPSARKAPAEPRAAQEPPNRRATAAEGDDRGDDDDRPSDEAPAAVPRELVVSFDPGSSASERRRAVSKAGAKIDKPLDAVDGAVLEVRGKRSTDEVAQRLSDSEAVRFVEPNYIVKSSRLPNDLSFNRLWGLQNTGQLAGTVGADVKATLAWDVITGGDVTVAVIDTGIDYRHIDLDENIWTNPKDVLDGVDNDGNGWVDDFRGIDLSSGDSDPLDDSSHGTHVAGIIGAEGNNAVGIAGISWKAKLMPLKFLDKNGEGNTADAAAAIDYAVASGAKVINASWGGPAFSQTLYQAVKQAGDRGVLFVAASGNSTANADVSPDYPAAFDLPNVISVAGSDPQDELLYFSNYGKKSVDLAAPGEEIYSTVRLQGGVSGYGTFSGTSMAAPFVSGAAALYYSRYPASSVATVRDALLSSADVLPSLNGKTATSGRLNVSRALAFGAPPPPQPAAGPAPDVTRPSPFRLLRPRNRYSTRKRGLRFRWQPSFDQSGIRFYKLYVDGKKRKTVRDPDGPGGRAASTRTRLKLRGGRHRWTVRAYDYAGNSRAATTSRRKSTSRRVLFVGRR